MDDVLKFCDSLRGSQKKKAKKFLRVLQNNSILRPFKVKFRFKRFGLSSAKRAQNKHEKNGKAQAKLLNVFSNDIMHKAQKRIFWLLETDNLQFAERSKHAMSWHWLENLRNIMCPSRL